MTEPLDFTTAGRQRNRPPAPVPVAPVPVAPKKAPKPLRDRAAPRMPPKRVVLVVALALLVLAAGGVVLSRRHRSKSSLATGAAPALQISTVEYCGLAAQLRDLALATHASSAIGTYDGSVADIHLLVQQMGNGLARIATDAPTAIRSAVTSQLAGLRQAAAGNLGAISTPTFRSATQKITSYQAADCPSGQQSGDTGS